MVYTIISNFIMVGVLEATSVWLWVLIDSDRDVPEKALGWFSLCPWYRYKQLVCNLEETYMFTL